MAKPRKTLDMVFDIIWLLSQIPTKALAFIHR